MEFTKSDSHRKKIVESERLHNEQIRVWLHRHSLPKNSYDSPPRKGKLGKLVSQSTPKNLNLQSVYNFDFFGLTNVLYSTLRRYFHDIQLVICCGSPSRARNIAHCYYERFSPKTFERIGNSEFFEVYKCDSVIIGSHGMGIPSINTFLNEIISMLHIAKNNESPQFIRLGSCGGVGVNAGSIVISSQALNHETLKPEYRTFSSGVPMVYPTNFNESMVKTLYKVASQKLGNKPINENEPTVLDPSPVVIGNTLNAETFYEGQSRLDGASCAYTESDKKKFLQNLSTMGVRNIEMEGAVLSGVCNANKIRSAMLCVVYLNRLECDSIPSKYSTNELHQWMQRAVEVILDYIQITIFHSDDRLSTFSLNK